MKTRRLWTAVVLAGVTTSLAIAGPAVGKGKPPTTGVGCKPQVTVVLKGTLVTAPGSSGTSFTMTVTGSNAHGKAYKAAAQPVSVGITPTTKVRRQGAKTRASLVAGDRLNVHSRVCKADLANGAHPALTAVMVIAHPAAAP
jgi:hypothetical protein